MLRSHFLDVDSEGIRLVEEQRPADALPGLAPAQFRRYVLAVFRDLIGEMESLSGSQATPG
ncbi:MAG: hypothetical protein C0418_06300 [Coriobacteriaceae bacterium]|nr:hypothetical protein [Coriobacteriaceae bacterium]